MYLHFHVLFVFTNVKITTIDVLMTLIFQVHFAIDKFSSRIFDPTGFISTRDRLVDPPVPWTS